MAFPQVWTEGDRAAGQRAARWELLREHAADVALAVVWIIGLVVAAVTK